MDLFELLPTEEEQGQLVWKILKYMFYDEIPILNDNQTRIFNNLKRPLDKSKKKSNKNQNEIKRESNQNQNETKIETHQDVNVNVNDNVYVNNLKKIGYGKEKTFKQIIDYLNEKTNSKFKYNTKATQQKINARLNEGYTLDDFIVVIDKKTAEWNKTEFEKYLCPETLFGTKFEKYLNQKIVTKNTSKKETSNNIFYEIGKEEGIF